MTCTGVMVGAMSAADNSARKEATRRVGAALRRLREASGTTAVDLARGIAARTNTKVAQANVSQWETGEKLMQLWHMEAAEDLMGLTRGAILAEAGFVTPGASARAALAKDEELLPFERSFLVESYDAAWRKSQATRDGHAVGDPAER